MHWIATGVCVVDGGEGAVCELATRLCACLAGYTFGGAAVDPAGFPGADVWSEAAVGVKPRPNVTCASSYIQKIF